MAITLETIFGEIKLLHEAINQLNDKVDRMDAKFTGQIQALDEKVSRLDDKFTAKFEIVFLRLDDHDKKFQNIDDRFKEIRDELKEIKQDIRQDRGKLQQVYEARNKVKMDFTYKWVSACFVIAILASISTLSIASVCMKG